jgi:enoyl-CoA hydratase
VRHKFSDQSIWVMEGHAYPMGTFLLLGCDVRIGVRGSFRMGLNEVAIGIVPPAFAVELARSRVHPAWLNRTVVLGEMFEPDEAVTAGFLDRVVAAEDLPATTSATIQAIRGLPVACLAMAKQKLRRAAAEGMRAAIDEELTLSMYEANATAIAAVNLPR